MYEAPHPYVAQEYRCQQPMPLNIGGTCGKYALTDLVGRRTCWECADAVRVLRDAIDRLEVIVKSKWQPMEGKS
jgi:hypothetical protein